MLIEMPAGIEDFRFHDLRHTAATRALRAFGNARVVRRMLGHKRIETTMRYAHSDLDDVRAAISALKGKIIPTNELKTKGLCISE